MSAHCHAHDPGPFNGLSPAYKRILILVTVLNAAMFAVELSAGLAAHSQALKADALDFLADSVTYMMSFLVIGASASTRAWTALLKGLSLAGMGAWVFGSTVYQVFVLGLPKAEVMGTVGVLALGVNLASVILLLRYREGDANIRSVWICSRNDAIGNVAVMLAAGAVWVTKTAWPDIVVAAAMAGLFLWSSLEIIRRSVGELRGAGGSKD